MNHPTFGWYLTDGKIFGAEYIYRLNIVSDASWREVCMTFSHIYSLWFWTSHFHCDFLIYNNNNIFYT